MYTADTPNLAFVTVTVSCMMNKGSPVIYNYSNHIGIAEVSNWLIVDHLHCLVTK